MNNQADDIHLSPRGAVTDVASLTTKPIMAATSFDPFSPEVLEMGPAAYSALKKQTPFYHYQGKFDFYINSDYDEIRTVILKDHTRWSFADGPGPVDAIAMRGTGISTDPPVHDHFRRVIQRGFTPKKLEVLSKAVERIADELIDKMLDAPEGEGDFYELFAKPLPSRLMCVMLGTPESNWRKYKAWSDEQIVQLMNADRPERVDEIMVEFAPHFFGLVNERKEMLQKSGITNPTLEHVGTILPDDFMSRYICDRVDGRPLEDHEVLGLGMSILGAGNETTINQITNLLWRLLEVPSRWEYLKANRHLTENALEESLRFDPPVLGMMRKCVRDTDMKGHRIRAGERVFYSIAGANREEHLWDEPDQFRIDRPLAGLFRHITFGGGNHICLGLALARMETKLVFQKLVARLPNLRLIGESERIKVFNFWGRSKLPVAWK